MRGDHLARANALYNRPVAVAGDGTFLVNTDKLSVPANTTTIYGALSQLELPLPNWTDWAFATSS